MSAGAAGAFDNDYSLQSLIKLIPSMHRFSFHVTPRFVDHYSNNGYERFSARLVESFVKGCDLFLDVGAHYGFYSLLAYDSNHKVKIISVEPIDENYEILKLNLESNGIQENTAKVIKAAATNYVGKADFFKSAASDNSSFFQHPNAASIGKVTVDCLTIDEILKNDCSDSVFIKVDTDGNELNVLKGMSHTIDKYKNISLLIEMNPKMFTLAETNCKEVLEYLGSRGFHVYGIDDRESKYYPLEIEENLNKFQTENSYFNALCVKKEKSLSVAFFSHSSALAGAERSLVDLVEDLCDDSVLCSVLLPSGGPLRDVLVEKGAAVHVLPGAAYGWWASNNSSLSEETQKFQFAQDIMAKVAGSIPILRRLGPDVVYTQTIVSPWGALCAEILSIPHALLVCEYGELDHQLKFYFGYKESIRTLYDSSKVIFSVTKSVKDEVFRGISDKENKIEVVYRSVRIAPKNDLGAPSPDVDRKNKSEVKIAIFGSIQEGKGQEDIVRAGIELMKMGRNVKVYIIGHQDPPHYLTFIKDLIGGSEYKENFIISDFVVNSIAHMNEMDIIISCSRHEAIGRTLMEAILLNKPIVYSDSAGPKEIFTDEEHGLAYKCADAHSLVEKLLSVMDCPDKAKQRVKQAREYVLKVFSPENYSGKIESRLRQIKGSKIQTSHSMRALLFDADFSFDALQCVFERKDAECAEQIDKLHQAVAARDSELGSVRTELHSIYTSKKWKLIMKVAAPVLLAKVGISKIKVRTKELAKRIRWLLKNHEIKN